MGQPKDQGPDGYRGEEAPFGIPENLPEEKAPEVKLLEEGGRQYIDPKLVPGESAVVFKEQGKAQEHGKAADQGKIDALKEGTVQAKVPEKMGPTVQGQHPQEYGDAQQDIGQAMADSNKVKLLVKPGSQRSKPGFVHPVVAGEGQKG